MALLLDHLWEDDAGELIQGFDVQLDELLLLLLRQFQVLHGILVAQAHVVHCRWCLGQTRPR